MVAVQGCNPTGATAPNRLLSNTRHLGGCLRFGIPFDDGARGGAPYRVNLMEKKSSRHHDEHRSGRCANKNSAVGK